MRELSWQKWALASVALIIFSTSVYPLFWLFLYNEALIDKESSISTYAGNPVEAVLLMGMDQFLALLAVVFSLAGLAASFVCIGFSLYTFFKVKTDAC